MNETRKTSVRNWTERQRTAFTTAGCSLLVSAAAGSGKTAVLAERCVYLVCDAPKPCDIGQLLVVTFTESAAAEMKTRVKAALRRRIEQNPSDRLKRQADLVEHANISTVHGFCRRVLLQNFHRVGLDPNFQILDGDDAQLLRYETAADLLEQRYESDSTGDFQRLVDAFGQGDEKHLIETVVDTHQLLCSLSARDEWIKSTLDDIQEAAVKPVSQSRLGKRYLDLIGQTLTDLSRQSVDGAASIRAGGKTFLGYAAQMDELHAMLEHWKVVLQRDGLDMLVGEFRNLLESKIPPAPTIRGDPPGKTGAKAPLDSIKDQLRKGQLKKLLMFDSAKWQEGMAVVAPHAQAFLGLVVDFEKQYTLAKSQERRLDFSDLERLTLRVLGTWDGTAWKPTPVARAFHEQFRHVLVDEYQDINDIQNAILTLVSQECLGSAGNLFCVGDVKQSIFRFRLADPRLFLDRQERFSKPSAPGQVIDLAENFRSRPPLLEAINGIFSRLMTRDAVQIEYDDAHRLRPGPGKSFPAFPDSRCFAGAPIELHLLTDESENESAGEEAADLTRQEREAILIATRIREMTGMDGPPSAQVLRPDEAGRPRPSPIAFGDIVILLRAMKYKADAFADVLRASGIPVHSEGGSGFFDSAEIRDMLCLLRILDNQRQDIPLAAILRSPLCNLPKADDCLARIRLAYRGEAEPVPFHQAVLRYSKEQTDEWAAHLKGFFERLQNWRDQANKRPAAELIWSIFQDTGYLAYVSGLDDGRQRVANLLELHQRAAQFSHFLRQGLGRFLRFLEALREQQDLERPSPASDASNVVRIMSIHRAKGLEFPVVFLPDLGKKHNLSDTAGAILADRAAGLGMQVVDERRAIRHDSLCSALVSESLNRQTLAEELRLLYVAMTRAREHLICIGTCGAKAVERWENLFRNHAGPLPADVVLGGSTRLDWLGPVWAMTETTEPPIFELIRHSADEWKTWKHPREEQSGFDPSQESLANLKPLTDAPGPDDLAEQVIARFGRGYAFASSTRQAAAKSVTALAKESPIEGISDAPLRKLDPPAFFAQSAAPKATDIGTATHRFLEVCDFAGAQLDRQIESLIERKLLSPGQAALIDRDAIRWFLSTDLARMLAQRQSETLREIPFALSQAPMDNPAAELLDRVMIRGRIDLLVRRPNGDVSVVDYKTDRVTAEEIAQRAQTYRGQMEFYRQALTKIAGAKIEAVYLVFLTPRIIEKL